MQLINPPKAHNMRKQFMTRYPVLFGWVLLLNLHTASQGQFTQTASRENNYCNGTCSLLDIPELNGNPTAVIFIKQVEVNGVNLDPHPICAYYTGKQWSIMNTDNATVPAGSQFSVQYFNTSDANHFTHIVTKENLVKNSSYIDHSGLNGNPNARFEYFQNVATNVRGGGINRSEIKFQYDDAAGKWFITNLKGNALDLATGYNISINYETGEIVPATTAKTISIVNPVTIAPVSAPFIPGPKLTNSGQRVFITVTGKSQGIFPGDNNTSKVELTGFEVEMISPRDLASGQATGKRQHLPFIIEKPSGTASVQFLKALTGNEQLSTVTFEIYGVSASGSLVLDSKIVLTNASIIDLKQSYVDGQKGMTDIIKMAYQSIEFTRGGITASDTWPSIN
jgi:type VI secretion system secreted protein Hcp